MYNKIKVYQVRFRGDDDCGPLITKDLSVVRECMEDDEEWGFGDGIESIIATTMPEAVYRILPLGSPGDFYSYDQRARNLWEQW